MSPDRPTPTVVRRHVVVEGAVQGVGFRASCARRAVRARVTGWVRNSPRGTVEALFEGPEDAVEAVVAWCREGPPMARVSAVQVHAGAGAGAEFADFSIR
ncbi:MAG TPA: acylphosphatase [Acidimicrobiales bacterium]|nr:acylphosphatase [Acidimicrobiales bacterium]